MRPAEQVAHERRETGTGDRVPPPNVDRAGADELPGASLRRQVEMAAAAIVWLLAGGIVAGSLEGTFEENDIVGPPSPRASDQPEEEPRPAEPGRPAREPLPPWLVPPQP